MKELISTNVRVTEIQPGLVETQFSIHRYRGDEAKAAQVYEGFTPLTGTDIAQQIAWVASRPQHVQVAELLVFPSAQSGIGKENIHRST